ncbi:MAG: rhodanese-like domain-containing protein [Candidatus Bathyarchaeia archaeon]
MVKKILAFLIATILMSTIVFSTPIKSASSLGPERTIPPIVSTEWLYVNLNIPNLIVLDIRSWDSYISGHIPGAVNVPESGWYINPPFSAEFPWMEIPSTQQLFSLIGNAGIKKDSLVVVVGGTSGPLSPMPLALYSTAGITRVAITLLYAGITNVAILDGGYDKWVAEGKPVSTAPVTPTPTTYTGVVQSKMIVSKQDVYNKIGQSIIVDSRDSEVYIGLVQEPWTNRTGHIPTARSLPTPWLWSISLDASGNAKHVTYKSYEDLETLAFDIIGSDVSREIVVYCGVGGYASTMYFVLSEVLGYRNVKMYDGSAQEWSYDPSLPIVNEDLGAGYMRLSAAYNTLKNDYAKLQGNYNSLSEKIAKLESDFVQLKSEYDKLKSSNEELQKSYTELAKTTTPAYLAYIFIATTFIFILAAAYLALRLRKT